MEDIHYKLKTNVENFFKIFTLPHKIPSEVLKNKKLVIGF